MLLRLVRLFELTAAVDLTGGGSVTMGCRFLFFFFVCLTTLASGTDVLHWDLALAFFLFFTH